MSLFLHRVGLLSSSSGSFDPLDLGATLIAWYDANQETESDGATLTWADQSGNNWDQTGGSSTVLLRHNYINGKKAADYTASYPTFWSSTSLSPSIMSGKTAGCYFAVARNANDPTSDPMNGPILGNFGSASRWPTTNGNILEGFGTNSFKTVNPTPSLTSWRIYSAHSAASDYRIYLDGTSIFSTGTNTVSFAVNTSPNNNRYFGDSEDRGNHFKGQIAEIIICDTVLSTGDRQKVEGYLAHKWGLTGNLDISHPYKSSPP